jgi:quinol monooxygenase YgiN
MFLRGFSAETTRDEAQALTARLRDVAKRTRKETKVDLYETPTAPSFWIVDWFASNPNEGWAESRELNDEIRHAEGHFLRPLNVVPSEFPANSTCVFARLNCLPGARGEMMELLDSQMTNTRKEPGNVYFNLFESMRDGSLLMFEAYRDQAALDTHRQSSYYRTNVPKIVERLARPIRVHTLV